VSCAYIAHLGALDRRLALALGAYTDPACEGCHDWDSFLRFWLAGHRPVHVPEVVYGWRMHLGSTSANANAKSFIYESQRALLGRFVASRPHPERYAVELNPLFPGTPDWHIRRRPTAPRAITTVVLGDADSAAVAQWRGASKYPTQRWLSLPITSDPARLAEIAREAGREGALLRLLWDQLEPVPPTDDAAMLWEAVGLFELFPDCAMVGGRLVDGARRIRSAGYYFGYGGGCDSPDEGSRLDDPGYHAQLWQQHSVSAVSSALAVVEPGFLADAIDAHRALPISLAFLGAWCGAEARRTGRRVVYSPFLTARSERDWGARVDPAERRLFLSHHQALIPDTALRSPRLSAAPGSGYQPA
jgi:hypothetical protein